MKKDRLIIFGLYGLSAISVVRFFESTDSWIINILSHFPVQYALLASILCGIFIIKKRILPAVFSVLLIFLNAGSSGIGDPVNAAASKGDYPFSIYSANINKANNSISLLKKELHKADSEIILLFEVMPVHIEELQSLFEDYPYRVIAQNLDPSNLQAVLLSRFPVVGHEIIKLVEGNVLISSTLEIDEREILFYGAHFPRPTDPQGFFESAQQILGLAKRLKNESKPVIIAGDFNTTPFSPVFKEFLRISGLRDLRHGFGWQPSWPAFFPPLWIPIDHILVSPGFSVHDLTTGSYIGSDHYPMLAELSLT
jgi:endonuclease/exonuclease/phosphatase (EEP) superfamily protein YafD